MCVCVYKLYLLKEKIGVSIIIQPQYWTSQNQVCKNEIFLRHVSNHPPNTFFGDKDGHSQPSFLRPKLSTSSTGHLFTPLKYVSLIVFTSVYSFSLYFSPLFNIKFLIWHCKSTRYCTWWTFGNLIEFDLERLQKELMGKRIVSSRVWFESTPRSFFNYGHKTGMSTTKLIRSHTGRET